MVKVKLLHPYPALFLEADQRYIVISDLHIGFESELIAKGINISSELYVTEMLDDLSAIITKEKPDSMILLGDIKSSVHTISKTEWDVIPKFLQKLTRMISVILVPGNHDGNIGHLVPSGIRMMSRMGILLDDTLLLHGHTMPTKAGWSINRLIMGHIHPVFVKRGSSISGQRIWVYLKVDKSALFSDASGLLDVVVLPSFNKYFYYTTDLDHYRKSISPVLKKISDKIEKAMLLTLDGAIVGNESLLQQVI